MEWLASIHDFIFGVTSFYLRVYNANIFEIYFFIYALLINSLLYFFVSKERKKYIFFALSTSQMGTLISWFISLSISFLFGFLGSDEQITLYNSTSENEIAAKISMELGSMALYIVSAIGYSVIYINPILVFISRMYAILRNNDQEICI